MNNQREEVLVRLRKVIVEQLDAAPDSVQESSSFIDDLGADSLAVVELVLALEETFGVTIPDEKAEELRTVGDAVTYLVDHGATQARAS